MKGGAQVALAVGVGYVLGRRRKMRVATMLALGAATGGLGGLGPAVLKRGMKYLGSTDVAGALGPQVNEIVSTIRGDLLDAGKAAATSAVSSRIDSLSDTPARPRGNLPESGSRGGGLARARRSARPARPSTGPADPSAGCGVAARPETRRPPSRTAKNAATAGPGGPAGPDGRSRRGPVRVL